MEELADRLSSISSNIEKELASLCKIKQQEVDVSLHKIKPLYSREDGELLIFKNRISHHYNIYGTVAFLYEEEMEINTYEFEILKEFIHKQKIIEQKKVWSDIGLEYEFDHAQNNKFILFKGSVYNDEQKNKCQLNKDFLNKYIIIPSVEGDDSLWALLYSLEGLIGKGKSSFFPMLYFSAVTTTTLGYGDIVPITNKARIAITIQTILGIILIGLFLNSLSIKGYKIRRSLKK